jgi:MFS transporter, ACS family, tartrate transporter
MSIDPSEASAIRKAARRLVPFLFVLYIAAWLDRVNVGFAALQMNQALRFSETAFGLGSGIFFIGYCLFEVPSNFILHRVGARRWIARIMVSWGVVGVAMMFVHTPWQFYLLRFLLGVAEAGFFPGVIYYLGAWFPRAHIARAIGAFMTAIPVAGAIGGPVSGALLGLDGFMGLGGWQWLFLIEGLPSILLGVWAWSYLTDRPDDADWLQPSEKSALISRLRAETQEIRSARAISAWAALRNPTVWHLGAIFFLVNLGWYGYTIWSPQIIKAYLGTGNFTVGLIAGAISVAVIVIMRLNCRHSDRTGERPLHVVIPLAVMASGFAAASLLGHSTAAIVCLALVPVGVNAAYGPFWSLPSSFLTGKSAAGGIAMVNTIQSLGGFVGPAFLGVVKAQTGDYAQGLLFLAAAAGAAALLTLPLRGKAALPGRRVRAVAD